MTEVIFYVKEFSAGIRKISFFNFHVLLLFNAASNGIYFKDSIRETSRVLMKAECIKIKQFHSVSHF